jgi:hypothetical protein
MGTAPSDSNAIDFSLKYGAAIAAVAYGLGFVEEHDLLRRFGIHSDFSLADPRYFAVGALLLSLSMLNVLVVVSSRDWFRVVVFRKPEEPGAAQRGAGLCFVLTFVGIFTISLTRYHGWIRDALWVSLAGACAAGMAVFEINRLKMRDRPGLGEQVYPLMLVTLCLLILALGAGKLHWRYLLTKEGQQQVRLLIEGDAVRGVQEMGLTFPQLQSGDKSAELSGPVEMVFESDRTYVLRVNGQVVRLGKGKVLGTVP